jgi:hypothetical protein
MLDVIAVVVLALIKRGRRAIDAVVAGVTRAIVRLSGRD